PRTGGVGRHLIEGAAPYAFYPEHGEDTFVVSFVGPRGALMDRLRPSFPVTWVTFPAWVEGRQEACPAEIDGKPGRAFCVCACHEDNDIGEPPPVLNVRFASDTQRGYSVPIACYQPSGLP